MERLAASFVAFEGKVERLKALFEKMRMERNQARLLVESLQEEVDALKLKNEKLEQQVRAMQAIRLDESISVDAAEENRRQLSILVREIDRCIAMLNE